MCVCCVPCYYFVNSLLILKRMATGLNVLTHEQETESSASTGAQYFCHECDKKFSCDGRSESDDVCLQ